MSAFPIILTAFSTSPGATSACQAIEAAMRINFPTRTILWGYNQRSVDRARLQGRSDILLVSEQLQVLAALGCDKAIIQPLHLLPGTEYHQLRRELSGVEEIKWVLGLPLFSAPSDFLQLTETLARQLPDDENQAILMIGHGTRHPSWTSYLALRYFLRQRFGKRAFVGVIEHFPESGSIEEEFKQMAYEKVLLVPFFFAGGIHVSRDMLGDSPHSWRTRLERLGLEVDCFGQGIGTLPGIDKLIIRHILDAENEDING